MVVALFHNPLGYGHDRWEVAISSFMSVFLHIQWESKTHFLVVLGILSLQSKRRLSTKGLRAELPVKES